MVKCPQLLGPGVANWYHPSPIRHSFDILYILQHIAMPCIIDSEAHGCYSGKS